MRERLNSSGRIVGTKFDDSAQRQRISISGINLECPVKVLFRLVHLHLCTGFMGFGQFFASLLRNLVLRYGYSLRARAIFRNIADRHPEICHRTKRAYFHAVPRLVHARYGHQLIAALGDVVEPKFTGPVCEGGVQDTAAGCLLQLYLNIAERFAAQSADTSTYRAKVAETRAGLWRLKSRIAKTAGLSGTEKSETKNSTCQL